MQKLSLAGLVLILFSLSHCAFHPDEADNFHVVDSLFTADPVEIYLQDEKDTIDVFGSTHFKFDVTGLGDKRAYDMNCTISSTFLSSRQDGSNYTFEYYPPVKIGYETMTLEIRQQSGTGSLADKAGVEGIIYKRTWILALDTQQPDPIPITYIGPGEGRLKLEWPAYQRKNFKFYQVVRSGTYDYTSWQINDIHTNYFYDSSFVGGKSLYWVRVISKTDTYLDPVPSVIYEDKVRSGHIQTSLSLTDSRINIPASRYPFNVDRYEVYERYENGEQIIHTTSDPLDTGFVYAARFGGPVNIHVKTIGKPKKTYSDVLTPMVYSDTLQYVFGEKIHSYEKILWAEGHDRFFTFEGKNFYVYSISGNQLIATIDLPASLAAGSLAQDDDFISFFYSSKLYRWNISNLTSQTFDLANAATTGEPLLFGAGLLANNKAMISRGKDSNLMGSTVIYDLTNEIVLKTYNNFAPFSSIRAWGDQIKAEHLSGFVTFFVLGDTEILYETVYAPFTPASFNPEQAEQLVYGDSNSQLQYGGIYFQDLKTWALTGKIETPAMYFTSIDALKGVALGYGGGNGIVFDYKNQNTAWSGPVTNRNFSVNGNYIYSPAGVRLKISE